MRAHRFFIAGACVLLLLSSTRAQDPPPSSTTRVQAVMPRVITWRRDFHQHPERLESGSAHIENRRRHLRALGLEVRTGVAKTGVIGVLRAQAPGASSHCARDMDGLPVKKDWTCRSSPEARSEYNARPST